MNVFPSGGNLPESINKSFRLKKDLSFLLRERSVFLRSGNDPARILKNKLKHYTTAYCSYEEKKFYLNYNIQKLIHRKNQWE